MKRKCAFVLLLCGLLLLSVPGYAAPNISITPSSVSFGTVTEGYVQDTYKQTLTLKNIGSNIIALFMADTEGGNNTAFVIETGAVYDNITAGETRSIILKPASNLAPGTYASNLKAWENGVVNEDILYIQLTFTVIAAVAPTFTSAASATFMAGTGGIHTFTATGDAPITFNITGALPTGVTLNNGVLTVDNTAAAERHTLTVTAANGVNPPATQTFTLNISAAPVTPTAPTQITPLEPTVTAGGSTTLTADGNPAPTFALDGIQPAGVTISASGTLSVASTVAPGTYTFDVTATNSEGSVTQTITLTVKAKSSSGGGSSDDWEPVEDIKSYEQAIVIKCREWANVRRGPSTDTDIVGRVYLGESISLLQWNKDETWCKILYDGDSKTGWLYYKFIKPVK